jgi:hypothetical protein
MSALGSVKGMGYVDGQNVTIEFRWAEGQCPALPVLFGIQRSLSHRRLVIPVQ